jgi:hypothetical protein
MPRTAYGRAPESRPTVTVPEALCTSVEEVSNRDQATNIKCSSNEVINTVSRREFEEECSKRGEKRRIEMNEKQCEIQVEKMKTRQNANRWKEVTLANRPNEVYRIPTNYTLILIGKLNAMSSNLAYERMKNIRLSARSNELQQHARLLQNKLEATENTILEMRHHQDEVTRLLHNDIMELHDQLIANEEC